MNIIIVGCGKVGEKLVERLGEEKEHNITVVDQKRDVVVDITNKYDVMGVHGSGTSLDILTQAGIQSADILIAVTGSDEFNLLTCLIAKKTGKCKMIARVRKPEYSKEIHLFKEDLGLAMIINPELAAANEIARILRFPSAIQIDTFAKGRVEILKFRLPEGSILDNMCLADLGPKLKSDILVCGVEREDEAFIPDGNFILRTGDLVSVIATYKNVAHFFKKIGIKTNKVKDTIIVGGGPISFYLGYLLLKSGVQVKIIEQKPEKCEALCQMLPDATIINGDGTDNRLLLEEGIEYADSFVALTNIDEENVLLSLFAKSKSVRKLVTKINRIAYDEVISNLDLDSTVYPKNITAEYIIRFVRAMTNSYGSNIETMHYILDGKAEALEFLIKEGSPISGTPIQELNLNDNILIACITRNGKVIIPRGNDIIETGDSVVIVTTNKGYMDISDILK